MPHTSLPAKLDPVPQVLVLTFDFCLSLKGCHKRNRLNKGEEYGRVGKKHLFFGIYNSGRKLQQKSGEYISHPVGPLNLISRSLRTVATRIWGGLHTSYLPLVANWRRQRWTSKSATSTSDGPIRDLGLGLPHFTCSCLNVCEEHIEPRTERFIEKHDAERERWSVVEVAHVLLTCFSFLYCLWWVRHGRAISSEVSSIRLISFSAAKVLLLVYSFTACVVP